MICLFDRKKNIRPGYTVEDMAADVVALNRDIVIVHQDIVTCSFNDNPLAIVLGSDAIVSFEDFREVCL